MDFTVSVITVVFNNSGTLQEAIDSVKNQTYPHIEHIIVDGGSTDGTIDIIKSNTHLSKWVSEPDDGIYDAMNKGIRMAIGTIVGLLNSDDIYADSEVIDSIVKAFQKQPSARLLYGDLVYVKWEDTDQIVRYWKTRPYYDRFFEHGFVPPHPTLFVRIEVYQEELYRTDFGFAADYELMLRLIRIRAFESIYLPVLIVKMRLGGKTSKNLRNIYKGNLEVMASWRLNGIRPPISFYPRRVLEKLRQFVWR